MSKAEDRALEALDMYSPEGINEQVGLVYTKAAMLGMFKDGYHQAEKDLELTWEDVRELYNLAYNLRFTHKKQKEFFEEVLKRFKEYKVNTQ